MEFMFTQYSEKQLIKFANQCHLNQWEWNNISCYQNLSERFIKKFRNKISWRYLRWNLLINVTDEFTIEFDKELEYDNQWYINNNSHRMLGPARIYDNGKKEYWYRGKYVEVKSDEEYFEWLKYKDF